MRRLLPVAVLMAGLAGSVALLRTAPPTEPREKGRRVRMVQVAAPQPSDESISVVGYGVVTPARELVVQPQVRGRVRALHPRLVPGGRVGAGETLLELERAEYELALAERRAELQEAQLELAMEQGRRTAAAREWKQLAGSLAKPEDANRSLVLREPHLRRAEALVERAEKRIARARLDLRRTELQAPFDAVVTEERVEVGQLLEAGSAACTLVGTDAFWVVVALPVRDVPRVALPDGARPGAAATVVVEHDRGPAVERAGTVERLLPALEEEGRLARLVVRIPDPLAEPRLLLGSYVRVRIDAGRLDGVLSIPRSALREGRRLWLAAPDDTLVVREVELLWERDDAVLVGADAIRPGERLVTSDLRVALPGMAVKPQP